MMKKLYLAAMLFLSALIAGAQETGDDNVWSGKLNVLGNEMTLVFHLDENACTLDSPDQAIKGIPATMELTENGVKVFVPTIGGSFVGEYADKSIVGTFYQRGQAFSLTLTHGLLKRNRPQTPTPPFPYKTQDVSFTNGDAVLKGTLVIPEKCTKETTVVIMVTGSGLQNRDEEIFEHKPFAVIADTLARNGIATLRYDDRGFGESTGDLVRVTTEDLKNDALAGVQLLREKFSRVGILGHSEGGTIGLMLAAEGKVDFVVSLAGDVVSGKQTLIEQNLWTLKRAGYGQEVASRYCEVLENVFSDIASGLAPDIDTQGLPTELVQNLQVVKAQCSTPYMRYFLALDVSDRLDKITCPVLAMNGTSDRQVACDENLNLLRNRLAGSKDIYAVEGVNHLFQHSTTGDPSEYKDIEETFAPEALDIIVTWLKKLP